MAFGLKRILSIRIFPCLIFFLLYVFKFLRIYSLYY